MNNATNNKKPTINGRILDKFDFESRLFSATKCAVKNTEIPIPSTLVISIRSLRAPSDNTSDISIWMDSKTEMAIPIKTIKGNRIAARFIPPVMRNIKLKTMILDNQRYLKNHNYQILTRISSLRYILFPGLTPKAL